MCVFSPPPDKGPDADHGLNVWLSFACIVLVVAVAITLRAIHNPSVQAMRIAALAERKLADFASGPRPAGAQTITPEGIRQ